MPDIFVILDNLGRSVDALREHLNPLRTLIGKDGPFPMAKKTVRGKGRRRRARRVAGKPGRPAKTSAAAPTRRRKPVSAKVRAMRKQQGRYMAAVRNLTAAQRAQVKKVRQEKGFQAAMKLAGKIGLSKRSKR